MWHGATERCAPVSTIHPPGWRQPRRINSGQFRVFVRSVYDSSPYVREPKVAAAPAPVFGYRRRGGRAVLERRASLESALSLVLVSSSPAAVSSMFVF